MGTYTPAVYPRRPKHSNIFTETIYQIMLTHYQYELNTAQYLMSPAEKWAYNMIFFAFSALLLSAVYYYLPSTISLGLQRLVYYFTGSHKLQVNGVDVAQAAIKSSGEAIAALNALKNASIAL